jgi:hypothetical protein
MSVRAITLEHKRLQEGQAHAKRTERETMLQDLCYAVRLLAKNKSWTAMVVLSLAIGIGANTTLFSGLNGLVFRRLAVSDPDTLVMFRYAGRNQMSTNRSEYGGVGRELDLEVRTTTSYPIYQELLKVNQTLGDISASAPVNGLNVVDGNAEIASASIATGNFLRLLGVHAVLGRTITAEDDSPGAEPVAVISYQYWGRRFGKDLGAVGKTVEINKVPVTIVGVMPASFNGRWVSASATRSLPVSRRSVLSWSP